MINPQLYNALCTVFGSRNVIPVKQGMKGNFKFGLRTAVIEGKVVDYRTICKVEDGAAKIVGEEFRVPCPFCFDHAPRLYINHLFGVKDKVTGKRYLWMANCYNAGCMTDFKNRQKLFEMVKDHMDIDLPLRQGREAPTDYRADWPGEVQSIYKLAKENAWHPAIQFAFARSWDVEMLSRQYDVRVILDPRYWVDRLRDRIIAPVYASNHEIKTWTARNVHIEDEQAAKWLHCPHIGTGNSVYGLAAASKYRVPRVVEGPADCWPHKRRNAGIFGKVLQDVKAKRIAKACSDAVAIAVCLDPEQDPRDIYEGRPHQLDSAIATLRKYTEKPIIRVELPQTSDPGSLDADVFDWHVERCAEEQKIKI